MGSRLKQEPTHRRVMGTNNGGGTGCGDKNGKNEQRKERSSGSN